MDLTKYIAVDLSVIGRHVAVREWGNLVRCGKRT